MRLETFRGTSLSRVLVDVRRSLGDDAMVVRTLNLRENGRPVVEVVAARAEEVEAFRLQLDGGRAAAAKAKRKERIGPYTVALVGPAGGGKSSALIKLALHPRGVGRKKVGLLTLDTHRVAGLEEMQTFAEITNLPLEVVYHSREIPAAIQRLRGCEVILVDCPGRAPQEDPSEWELALQALDPDEVHLVLSAEMRDSVALRAKSVFAPCGVTHALFTKLDHLERDAGLAELAQAVGLPTRWVADGHEIPGDLKESGPRILSALGLGAVGDGEIRRVG